MPSGRTALVTLWTRVMRSVRESHTPGMTETISTQMKRITEDAAEEYLRSESFIYAEYKGFLTAGESVVETHVGEFLELPAVANAVVGQDMGETNF